MISSKLTRLAVLAASPALEAVRIVRNLTRRAVRVDYFIDSARYPEYLHSGQAMAFCLEHAKRHCRGAGVDVGAGVWPFPGARGIEDSQEENAYKIREADAALDFVFSSHCLEHLEQWQDALLEWKRVLKPGGILYLYLPHPACTMWSPKVLPFHKWQPAPDPLADHLRGIGFEIAEHSVFPDAYLSFFIVARRSDSETAS